MGLEDKIIITAALAGALTFKEQNPAVPYGVEECIEEAYKARNSGAAIVHIHARTQIGLPTKDPEIIGSIVEGIKSKCDVLINLSTAGGIIDVVKNHQPDLASLNTSSMNFGMADWHTGKIRGEILFVNTFKMIEDFNEEMKKAGTKPEFEVYDIGHLYNVLLLRKQGVFAEPMHFQYVFGVAGGIQFTPKSFAHFRVVTPPDATWSVCGVGPNSFKAAFYSAVNGGHIRVGLEDNIYISGKTLAKGNWELVEKAVKIAKLADRESASPQEAREILNLSKK